MKKIFKFCFTFFSLMIILFYISGCKKINDSQDKQGLIKKINTEILYIDGELISIINELNNIDYSNYKVEVQKVENPSGEADAIQSESGSSKQTSEEKNTEEDGKGEGEDGGKSGQQSNSDGGDQGEKSSEQDSNKGSTDKSSSMKSNNILEGETNIDWKKIKSKIEGLYASWTIMAMDLSEVGVTSEQLNNFVVDMDKASLAIKNENKTETIDSLINLYRYLPIFSEKCNDNKRRNILDTKYNLLLCYKYADVDDWEQLQDAIGNLKMSFLNIVSQRSEYKGKELNIESAGIVLGEMADSSEIGDREIFFIKYRNLMQELNLIMEI